MRYRSPYTLFKKTLRSGKKIWYYYFYDERNVRRQFSTGCATKAQAEAVCLELYRSGSMIPTVQNPIALISIRSTDSILSQNGLNGKVPLFLEFTENWFVYDKCEYIQKKLQYGYSLTRSYAYKRRMEIEVYILPFWGNYRLNEVTEELSEKWTARLKNENHLGNATINSVLKGFKTLLAYAYKKGITKTNMSNKVRLLKNNSRVHGIFTKDEAEKLLDEKTIDRVWNRKMLHYLFSLTASKTGMRIGEIQALRKEDLFPDHIEVQHGWSEQFGLQDTKNHKSRTVPISADLYEKLRRLSETQTEGDFIFSATGGKKPIHRTDIYERFKRSLREIGISDEERNKRFITFHSWRHYVNSLLVNSGVPRSIVQSLIGHVDDDAMTEHYTHVTLDDARRVLDVM